jgi:hypothetical protein
LRSSSWRPRQLIASFDFAGRITEFVEIPRVNFDLGLVFAWRGAFCGMGHIAFLAFKNVQVGKTIEPSGLSAQAHYLRTVWAMRSCRL